ncbi:DUF4355 domain-containing protein [Jeotgalibacillus haloalkalitolerans]|uniref:DUF4355 domain-containing protein n=1 Tax=Jeotgalibacillus haloalkalitolerans TaxID=3104292 RepID=A0ABU5KK65_9BACL|nr:DUF4355 domain-containing protein [Jeotgalibacillus sp. HH7-29]MDZ5711652.1 DUF4355 domain-containing protein [Jeotgalibacillus sp. HH7-29]
MNLEEVRAWLEANRNDSEVSAYLGELSTPTVEGVEGFLDTDAGRKLLQPRLDSNFTKGLNTWKDKNLDKLIEEEVKKRNPDKTPEQIELENLRKELEDQKNEAKREKLMSSAMKEASTKGLPTGFLDLFVTSDEETTLANLKRLEETYSADLQKAVDERFQKGGRKIPSGDPNEDNSVGSNFAKSANEQSKPASAGLWD